MYLREFFQSSRELSISAKLEIFDHTILAESSLVNVSHDNDVGPLKYIDRLEKLRVERVAHTPLVAVTVYAFCFASNNRELYL